MDIQSVKSRLSNQSDFCFEDFLDLILVLRSPEGCPWDRKQTAASLRKALLEEVYEVIDAVDQNDIPNLREELGDLMLTTLMVCRIKEEEAEFSLSDVINEVCLKLIRRHPHVFSTGVKAETSEDVLKVWNSVKVTEKQNTESSMSLLDEISSSLPPLEQAYHIQKKVSRVGFDWDDHHQVIKKIQEEALELGEALESMDQNAVEDEMGDLLFSVVNLARFLKLDPAIALNKTNKKFKRRFRHVEQSMARSGKEMVKDNMSDMDKFWEEAKKDEN